MIDGMPRPRPPHLHREATRHGTVVWYVRIGKGPRTRIKEAFGTPEFDEAYQAAIAGTPRPSKGAKAGTLAWLIARYKDSAAWAALSQGSRNLRDMVFRQAIETSGDVPFASISRSHIIAGRERRKAKPAMALHFLSAMRALFRWAVDADLVAADPTQGVRRPHNRSDGHHVWTDEECDLFEAKWPVGTRERLAFDILLYTGLRKGDAVTLGRQHVKNGIATIRTEKTGEVVSIPILPPLAASIKACPTGDMAFITGKRGQPLNKGSFGIYFRRACNAAGVPGSAHGLRKAGATRAANNGATVAQLEALFGWRGGGMASLYTRKADRGRLAKEAAGKLMRDDLFPHPQSGAGMKQKNGA